MPDGYLLINEPPIVLLDTVVLRHGKFTVGRSTAVHIYLPDKTVSRKHAEISVTPTGVRVHDLGSSNGTFVDGEQVSSATVKTGQHLRFGRVSFELAIPGSQAAIAKFHEFSTEKWKSDDAGEVAQAMRSLTPAQRGVLELVLEGKSQKMIAELKNLSVYTVHNHLRKVYEAFHVHSRAELIAFILRRPQPSADPLKAAKPKTD